MWLRSFAVLTGATGLGRSSLKEEKFIWFTISEGLTMVAGKAWWQEQLSLWLQEAENGTVSRAEL